MRIISLEHLYRDLQYYNISIMTKVATIILFLFSFVYGQISPYASTYKLLAFDKKDQVVTDAMQMGNALFFSVPFLDSIMSPYPQKYSKIIKTDSAGNVIDEFIIKPDSIRLVYVEKLFKISHPITSEPCLGVIGTSVKIDTISQDTLSYVFGGWILPDFSAHAFSFTYPEKQELIGNISAMYPLFSRKIQVANDTIVVVFMDRDSSILNYILATYIMDISGFTPLDTLVLHSENMFLANPSRIIPCLYKVPYNKNIRILYSDKNGVLRYFDILSFNPVQLATLPIIGNFVYLPTNLTLNKLYVNAYSDTTFNYGVGFNQGQSYHYLWKWYNSQANNFLIDSLQIEISTNKGVDIFGKPISLFYPYLYTVISQASWEYLANIYNWDFSWMHDTLLSGQGKTFFQVHLLDARNLQPLGVIALGGDAYYGVHGIIAPSDSVCIVYGWRFPLGYITRTDGDAFIWKISWNSGIVTPILGDAPQFSFKIFPNPMSERLYVQGKSKDATTLLLHSLNGKEVLRKKFSAGALRRELDVSALPKGVYVLEILTETGRIFSEKVVLE